MDMEEKQPKEKKARWSCPNAVCAFSFSRAFPLVQPRETDRLYDD